MAEDQGVNGNMWNAEASVLFKKVGWNKIADANIDIQGFDNSINGIDTLMKYENPTSSSIEQGVFLEAKRYKTSSFQKQYLQKWILNLDEKIRKLKNSETFIDQYPEMGVTDARNGLLLIWFADIENYKPKYFQSLLDTIELPNYRGINSPNRIFVMDNQQILRISSIIDSVNSWQTDHPEFRFRFYYPSFEKNLNPIERKNILTLEYLYSKFIFAEAADKNNLEKKIVFYFGELNIHSFKRLKNALYKNSFIDKEKSLTLFTYKRDDENFRKIKPDIERLFEDIEFKMKAMIKHADLPPWLKNF